MIVPLADLRAQYQGLKTEIDAAVGSVLAGGGYIDGPTVQQLERDIALLCGAQQGIGVASGTDALVLALVACGVGAGDEVITTPFTFGATTEAIALVGATPVYVDINACTFNLDEDRVAAAITPRTRALLPVDLFGQMTNRAVLNELCARHNLRLIVDAAQAIGTTQNGQPVGAAADVTTLSFYPTKNLGACGDAGMVLTNDADVAARVRSLHGHGQSSYAHHEHIGYCSRLDTVQAAILSVKLPRLGAWNEARRRNAARYHALLADLDSLDFTLPGCESGNHHVYHQYTVRHTRRDALQAYLKTQGVDSKVFYPLPMHLQPAYRYLGHHEGDFPIAERMAREVLSLPIVPELDDAQIVYVADCIRRFCTA